MAEAANSGPKGWFDLRQAATARGRPGGGLRQVASGSCSAGLPASGPPCILKNSSERGPARTMKIAVELE